MIGQQSLHNTQEIINTWGLAKELSAVLPFEWAPHTAAAAAAAAA
jgi:hypothetical protein